MMRARAWRWVLVFVACAAIGAAAAHVEVAWRCRGSVEGQPRSEGCVWGHAYLPVTRVAYAFLVGVPLFGAAWLVAHRRDRR